MGRAWLVLFLLVGPVSAVFVKIRQSEPKCFLEIIRHDIVLVNYKSPDQGPLPPDPADQKKHVGLNLEVFSEKGKVFEGRTEQQGRFAFTTLGHGEHRLCFSVAGQSLGQDFRLNIDITQGLPYIDYEALAKKNHLSSMELKVRKINDEIERIRNEQVYFRDRELRFRQTTDSTNFRSQVLTSLRCAHELMIFFAVVEHSSDSWNAGCNRDSAGVSAELFCGKEDSLKFG